MNDEKKPERPQHLRECVRDVKFEEWDCAPGCPANPYAKLNQTGRLSGQGPALQSIPTQTELGKELRDRAKQQFGSFPADFSQIELRVLSEYKSELGDPKPLHPLLEEIKSDLEPLMAPDKGDVPWDGPKYNILGAQDHLLVLKAPDGQVYTLSLQKLDEVLSANKSLRQHVKNAAFFGIYTTPPTEEGKKAVETLKEIDRTRIFLEECKAKAEEPKKGEPT